MVRCLSGPMSVPRGDVRTGIGAELNASWSSPITGMGHAGGRHRFRRSSGRAVPYGQCRTKALARPFGDGTCRLPETLPAAPCPCNRRRIGGPLGRRLRDVGPFTIRDCIPAVLRPWLSWSASVELNRLHDAHRRESFDSPHAVVRTVIAMAAKRRSRGAAGTARSGRAGSGMRPCGRRGRAERAARSGMCTVRTAHGWC